MTFKNRNTLKKKFTAEKMKKKILPHVGRETGFGPKGHFITNSQTREVTREKAVVYCITQ